MKALCLGGSAWQVDLIRRAGELGLETLVADINPDCPGRAAAKAFVQVDTNDRGALLEIARNHAVDLVLAEQTDRVVPVAAFLNETLGLPGIRPEVAERFTDKAAMRNALRGKVPMPAYAEISTREEAVAFGAREGYPLVLKPKRAQSSMGVFKVDGPEAVLVAFTDSQAHSQDGRILVERFIEGPEITVEGLCLGGKFQVLAVSEKEHYGFNPCVARRLSYPPRYGDARMARIIETATTVVEGLGLVDGISHAEYRLLGDVPHLVEVAARGGGNRIASRIVPHVSGVDMYELLIRRLSGSAPILPAVLHRAASLDFLEFAPGTVKAIHGLEQVKAEGLAWELALSFGPGSVIGRPSDDRNRLGYAIVLGEDRDDVDARCARIKALLSVEYR
jgi:biotin carboxylase